MSELVLFIEGSALVGRMKLSPHGVTSVLFGLAHFQLGMLACLGALVFDVCAALLVVRYGLLGLAVFLHVVVDLVLVRWNP